jgi:hypothetical protein
VIGDPVRRVLDAERDGSQLNRIVRGRLLRERDEVCARPPQVLHDVR